MIMFAYSNFETGGTVYSAPNKDIVSSEDIHLPLQQHHGGDCGKAKRKFTPKNSTWRTNICKTRDQNTEHFRK
jgi:hypothetical protein